jgi:hypothetical protein
MAPAAVFIFDADKCAIGALMFARHCAEGLR